MGSRKTGDVPAPPKVKSGKRPKRLRTARQGPPSTAREKGIGVSNITTDGKNQPNANDNGQVSDGVIQELRLAQTNHGQSSLHQPGSTGGCLGW